MEANNVSDQSISISRSESKLMVKEKRSGAEFGEKSELGGKRVKMQDLNSSEGYDTDYPKSNAYHNLFSYGKEKSLEVSKDAATRNSDVAPGEITRDLRRFPQSHCVGLNTKLSAADGDMPTSAHNLASFRKHDIDNDTFSASRGFGWDLNAEDTSNSPKQDHFHPFKNHEQLKSGDASECGSTTGSSEEKDSMKVWKEMKQNGFISSSRGGITVPKPRGRKSKTDGLKKKMELAKREQVNRFAKIAAPSGLLNELNPGIINHVRNSKQVHSIIEAMVRSEKLENQHSGGRQIISLKSGTKEITERKKDMENVNGRTDHSKEMENVNGRTSHSHEDGSLSTLSETQQKSGFTRLCSESLQFNSDDSRRDGDLSKVERMTFGKTNCPSDPNQHREDDMLALKLLSCTTMASGNTSSLYNEESVNGTGVSSLSVEAANVASRWLELLHQDTKGRLTALRRSKKRVRAVIHTELPMLMSREFSCNQENNPYVMKNSAAECSDNAKADMHRARWTAVFDQMDKSLSEEEKRLEIWLNQVKDMQLHCERGLQHIHHSTLHGSQLLGAFENDPRLEEVDGAEKELAVMAAAASIYSTCNFLSSKENLPCF